MSELEPALEQWQRTRDAFRWELPDRFNFGRDVVDRYARETGRPALLWRGPSGAQRRLTFEEVARASNQVAHLLRSCGMGPGDPILVLLPKLPEWQIALVGALKAGCLVIPGSTLLRPRDLLYRARHSGASAILVEREQVAAAAEVARTLPHLTHRFSLGLPPGGLPSGWQLWEEAVAAQPEDDSATRDTAASDPALVYYTSGTTGPPKAVLHRHAYTLAQSATARFWLGVREGDRVWTTSDTGWAKAAYSVLFGPWSLGAEVCMVAGRFDPAQELRLLSEMAPQVFCAPPTEYRLLVKEPLLSELSFPALRECVSAGEPLNPEVIRAWREATGIPIRDGFGQTETILLVGNFPGNAVRPGSMGLPMPGHRVEVIDPDGHPLPPGEIGEIAVGRDAPSLFQEYWKDPESTARAHLGEWYRTGDRAWRDPEGYFWFVGRADDVIISAGYRIGPFEVESALIEHPDVLEAAAVAAPDPDRGHIVKAFVVLRTGAAASDALARDLQEHVKRVTAPYKYPRRIEFVPELPKTVSGKIRRVELRER